MVIRNKWLNISQEILVASLIASNNLVNPGQPEHRVYISQFPGGIDGDTVRSILVNKRE